MGKDWYGRYCINQICQFEEDSEGIEDKSSPVLIYCKNQEGTNHDHEGNCNEKYCPLNNKQI